MIHDSLTIFDWQPLRCPPVKSVSVALRRCVGQPRTRGSWSDWRLRWQKCAVRCQTWKGSWKLAVEPVESPLRKPRSTSTAPPWTQRWDPAANPVNCSTKRPFHQDTLAVVCTELFLKVYFCHFGRVNGGIRKGPWAGTLIRVVRSTVLPMRLLVPSAVS